MFAQRTCNEHPHLTRTAVGVAHSLACSTKICGSLVRSDRHSASRRGTLKPIATRLKHTQKFPAAHLTGFSVGISQAKLFDSIGVERGLDSRRSECTSLSTGHTFQPIGTSPRKQHCWLKYDRKQQQQQPQSQNIPAPSPYHPSLTAARRRPLDWRSV
jgi:hypothetical protein